MPNPIRILDVNADFIAGKGTFLYQEVLDDIPNAKMIRLLTFNTDKFMDSVLYDSLHKMKYNTDFKWIFNFVSRKSDNPKYASMFNKEKFEKDLYYYNRIIESSGFKSRVDVVVNCTNHAKIFGTENVVYVGSQNFSTASTDNYELGFIVKDKVQIQKIYKFFDEVYNAAESIHYYNDTEEVKKLTKALIILSTVMSLLEGMYTQNDAEYYDNSYVYQFLNEGKEKLDYVMSQLNDIDEYIQEESYYSMFEKAVRSFEDLFDKIYEDPIFEELRDFDFIDRQYEETENYENRYEEWAAVRDSDIMKEFDSMYNDLVEKNYLEELQNIFDSLKSVHKEIGKDPEFTAKLDNSEK